mmetsp:Transcript_31417/g.91781  ORF Transcript_31417/g.91781 Transcript_31417/m.91781 type:complete len:350 (+) Transcript_31417:1049-2098(+)
MRLVVNGASLLRGRANLGIVGHGRRSLRPVHALARKEVWRHARGRHPSAEARGGAFVRPSVIAHIEPRLRGVQRPDERGGGGVGQGWLPGAGIRKPDGLLPRFGYAGCKDGPVRHFRALLPVAVETASGRGRHLGVEQTAEDRSRAARNAPDGDDVLRRRRRVPACAKQCVWCEFFRAVVHRLPPAVAAEPPRSFGHQYGVGRRRRPVCRDRRHLFGRGREGGVQPDAILLHARDDGSSRRHEGDAQACRRAPRCEERDVRGIVQRLGIHNFLQRHQHDHRVSGKFHLRHPGFLDELLQLGHVSDGVLLDDCVVSRHGQRLHHDRRSSEGFHELYHHDAPVLDALPSLQ